MKCVYLVKNETRSKFKVGFTINPRARAHNYKSHSPENEFIGYVEVPDKNYEKQCHKILLQKYKKCKVQGNTEWFEGEITLKDLMNMIKQIEENNVN